jgi:hypothetical protein
MAINNSKLLSGRVPVTPYSNLTSDRYQFLGLEQAEPSLGAGANNSVLTISTSNTRVWSNALTLSSLTVNGVSNIGNVGNVIITGGTNGYYLQTDGSGNLTWAEVPAGTGISNGNSSVTIPVASGNVVTTANGNIILTVTETGANIAGTLDVTGVSNLGPIGNVRITGGSTGQLVRTDGNGNLTFIDPAVADSAAPMPYYIPVGETYYVPENFQGLFTVPIEIDGAFEVNGILAEVGTAINSLNSQIIFDDNGELTGNTGFTFDTVSGNLAVPGAGIFTGALLPSANITYDLGSSTQRWRDLYLANNTIYINTSTIRTDGPNLILTNGDGGQFVVSGNSLATTYSLSNGTSNLNVNTSTISFSANGNANVLIISDYGINIAGTLSTTGNAAVSGILTNNYYYANGQPLDVGGNPGGSNTYVQFNNDGEFGGSANFTFNSSTNVLNVTGNITASNANLGNVITANYLISSSGCVSISNGTIAVIGNAGGIFNSSIDDINIGLAANIVIGSTTGLVTVQGNLTSNHSISATGNVSGNLLTGTLTTASQPNITSTGTLTSLSVTGNLSSANLTVSNTIDAINIKVTDLYSKRPAIPITSNTPIDTFPINQFRSAKYTMRAGNGTDYQALEVLLVHNDINSIITVYGSLSTSGSDLVVFDTDISAGNVNVYATAVGANTNLNLMGTYVPD